MAKVQKVYRREFKEEAVRLVQTSGKSIAQIARELGISDTSILQWRKELAEHGKAGLLHHSDCGCQYTSRAYRKWLEQAGAVVTYTSLRQAQ